VSLLFPFVRRSSTTFSHGLSLDRLFPGSQWSARPNCFSG
jgi:hypothetical protein